MVVSADAVVGDSMTDKPGSARFQALLESALQDYEKNDGVTLGDSEDLLAIRLQRCHSIRVHR